MPDLRAGLPRIRRARGYRLYGFDGRRYLDLHQEGGRAILGHGAGPALSAAKNAMSAGLLACLPSVHGQRFLAALSRSFPTCASFALFSSQARAIEAASRALGAPLTPADMVDLALDPPPAGPMRVARWRPWLPRAEAERQEQAEVILPVLPFAIGEAPVVVCARAGLPAPLPESELLPGFLLAGSLRGLEALAATEPGGEELLRLERVLDECPAWRRRGRYVCPRCGPEAYPAIHLRFLQAGVLLSPSFPGPSILPAEFSAGEGALLAALFQKTSGG